MGIMWKVVQIPAGDITNLHYNFLVAKPLVTIKVKQGCHNIGYRGLGFSPAAGNMGLSCGVLV